MGKYKHNPGNGQKWLNYVDELFILDIRLSQSGFEGFTLTNTKDETESKGSTLEELKALIGQLHTTYDLKYVDGRYEDRLIIFVDNLELIRVLFLDYRTDLRKPENSLIVECGNIEFREWKRFVRKNPVKAIRDWGEKFKEAKYPYLSPSHYMRKKVSKVAKGKASQVFPSDIRQLSVIESAVHGGVLYNRPEEGVITGLLGFDICSAYIRSLIFKKHASSEMLQSNPSQWQDYLRSDNKGSVGIYRITYNSIFTSIRCFHDNQGNKLETGEHTVEITLSNLDLRILLDNTYPGVSSVTCLVLYTFKMDYLPEEFRKLCAEEFLKKESLSKDTAAYINQKTLVNGGFFGNLLYDAKRLSEIDDFGERRHALKKKKREAAMAPQWGIFTMAHARNAVFEIGLNCCGWHYSDTDSVYCDDDSYNRKLVEEFNRKVREENIELCHILGYDRMFGEDACKLLSLGTFKLEAEIKQFRAWGTKVYAYETIDGKVIQKASGYDKEKLPYDADVVFNPDYKPTAR